MHKQSILSSFILYFSLSSTKEKNRKRWRAGNNNSCCCSSIYTTARRQVIVKNLMLFFFLFLLFPFFRRAVVNLLFQNGRIRMAFLCNANILYRLCVCLCVAFILKCSTRNASHLLLVLHSAPNILHFYIYFCCTLKRMLRYYCVSYLILAAYPDTYGC